MKKQLMLAKQGVCFKIISILLQLIVAIPLFLLLSFIVSSVIIEITDSDSTILIFKTVFILFNVLWFVRNSIVKIYSDKIVVRDWIGAKQIIVTENITSLKIIDYKELRKMMFDSSGTNPVITNAFVLVIPMGNFITFKNKFGRDVVIGVWQCDKLYEFLRNNLSENLSSESIQKQNNSCVFSDAYSSYDEKSKFICFVKMPFKYHFITYFKLFPETIIIPLFFCSYIGWRFDIKGVNIFILLLIALALSFLIYYLNIRVVVDKKTKTIRLKIFLDRNKNVIKYNELRNLRFINFEKDITELNKKSSFFISTPYFSKNINELIAFELPNDIGVILSVNKPDELYELLKKSLIFKADEE